MERWIEKHSISFGMSKPEELGMLQEWAAAFDAAGFSEKDLLAATSYMVTRDAPKFRTDHLAGIQRFLNALRSSGFKSTDDPRGTCTACGATGWRIVPHPKYITGLEWMPPFPTCGVVCECARGLWMMSRLDDHDAYRTPVNREKVLRFSEYRNRFPNWEDLVQSRESQRKASDRVLARAAGLDKILGSLAARLKA